MNDKPILNPDLVLCRMGMNPFDDTVPDEFMWMPSGVHLISAERRGAPIRLAVRVTREAADRVKASFVEWRAAFPKLKPFGDIEHKKEEAAFWPQDFSWRDDGIYVRAEWSDLGRRSVAGRIHRSLSPEFDTDADYEKFVNIGTEKDPVFSAPEGVRGSMKNPAEITGVGFVVGCLTNIPAFKNISPIKAKEAQAASSVTAEPNKPNQQKGNTVEPNTAEIEAVKKQAAEKDELIRAKDAAIKDSENRIAKMNEKMIDLGIHGAVTRGALDPKGDHSKVKARAMKFAATDIEAAIEYLDSLPVTDSGKQRQQALGDRLTEGADVKARDIRFGDTSIGEAIKGYVTARVPINDLMRGGRVKDAVDASRASSLVYANDLAAKFDKGDFMLRDLVRAATTTDANVGSLAGDLISQRVVEFLVNFLPMLSAITTDFRNEPLQYGQTVIARYLGVPTLLTYSTSTGWGTDAAVASGSTPSATDIPVAVNTYKGVEIRFDNTVIGGTVRNLFAEQVTPSAFALAQAVVQAVIAVITTANFTTTPLTISLANFKGSFPTLRAKLDELKVPRMPGGRTVLVNTDYENKLLEDTDFLAATTMRAAYRGTGPDTYLTGELPEIVGIKPIGTQEMTANNANRAGFLFGKSALCLASRIPNDYTTIFPDLAPTAQVSVVSHSNGLSMMMVRYLNHQLESGNQRVALMYGTAKGQPGAGVLIKSA